MTGQHPSHIILKPGACGLTNYHGENDWRTCPVCEGGLSVCAICGTYEAGLDGPCVGTAGIEWNEVGHFSEVSHVAGLVATVGIDLGYWLWEIRDPSNRYRELVDNGRAPVREVAREDCERAIVRILKGDRP